MMGRQFRKGIIVDEVKVQLNCAMAPCLPMVFLKHPFKVMFDCKLCIARRTKGRKGEIMGKLRVAW